MGIPSDIYIGYNTFLIKDGFNSPVVKGPSELRERAQEVYKACSKRSETLGGLTDFSIRLKWMGDVRTFRVSRLSALNEVIWVLRPASERIPELESLKIAYPFRKRLSEAGQDGLILICGSMASGKTTTAVSVVDHRLTHQGGVCVTIEDPIEYVFEKRYEKGVCFQTEALGGDFAPHVKNALRTSANMIFVGEVRDGPTAFEVLRASLNGSLVICTFHASSVQTALERFVQISLSGLPNSRTSDISSMLANALRGVYFQTLTGKMEKRPIGEMLWMCENKDMQPDEARQMIRNQSWERLESVMNVQRGVYRREISENRSGI